MKISTARQYFCHPRESCDAGRSNQILTSTTLTNWTPLTDVYNPSGTISITNPNPATQTQLFFRARVLP
jgi:hypothetical protein